MGKRLLRSREGAAQAVFFLLHFGVDQQRKARNKRKRDADQRTGAASREKAQRGWRRRDKPALRRGEGKYTFICTHFSVCSVHSVVGHSFYNGKRTTEHTESTENKNSASKFQLSPLLPAGACRLFAVVSQKYANFSKSSKNMYEQTVNTPLTPKPKSWPVSSLFQTS